MTDVARRAGDREIVGSRVFDAPREVVWRAWTEPERVTRWWGPNGFRTTIHEMDVRPGGEWRFIMHGPDGTDYDNHDVYVEVVRPELLVYDHVSIPKHRATVRFSEQDGKTRVDMHMEFESEESLDWTELRHHAVEGLTQTLGRLVEYLGGAA